MSDKWVETLVATDPVDKSKIPPPWVCICDSVDDPAFGKRPVFQLWICRQDLKEEFEPEARELFGDAIQQIVTLGYRPSIDYNRWSDKEDDKRWKWPPLYGPVDE